jgi:hypothetical protein
MGISNLKAVAEAAGISEESLKEAIASEEAVELEVPTDRVIKTKEEFDTYTANVKKEAGKASVEMAVKAVRNELDLKFEGKTVDNLLESYKSRVLEEAQIEPDKKITALQSEVDEFKTKLKERNDAFGELEGKYKREGQERTINGKLLDAIPDNVSLAKEDILLLFKSKHDVELSEDGISIKRGGEVLKDDNLNALAIDDVMKEFIQPYAKKPEGGSGKGTETGNFKAGTIEAFDKRMSDQGHAIGSEAYNSQMTKEISDGTLKV